MSELVSVLTGALEITAPIYVFHSWLSVPVEASQVLANLYSWVCEQMEMPICKWISLLLQEEKASTLLSVFDILPKSYVYYLPVDQFENQLSQKIDKYALESNTAGTIVLLSNNGNYPALRKAKVMGWKVIIAHLRGATCQSLQLANKRLEIPEDDLEIRKEINSEMIFWDVATASSTSTCSLLSTTLEIYDEFDKEDFEEEALEGKVEEIEESFEEFLIRVLPSSEKNIEFILEEANKPRERIYSLLDWKLPVWSPYITDCMENLQSEGLTHKTNVTLASVCKAAAQKKFIPKQQKNSAGIEIEETIKPIFTRRIVKFAPQCPLIGNKGHEIHKCNYWHPKKNCEYYPKCFSNADSCGYAHPFCSEGGPCQCIIRDPQMNHRAINQRFKALSL